MWMETGKADVFLAGAAGKSALFRNTGEGGKLAFEEITWRSPGLDGGGNWETGASMADVDGDGDLDLYVCRYDAPNTLFINDGNGRFVERGADWGCAVVDASLFVQLL